MSIENVDMIDKHFKTADWKTEKHVPVIDAPTKVSPGEQFSVELVVGKEIAHPNTTEHHIRWIDLYFQGEGDNFTFQVGHFAFTAHGEATDGPNQGPVHTNYQVTASLSLKKSGTLMATSYCNVHGLWQSARKIEVN